MGDRYGFNFRAIDKHGTWELRHADGTLEPKRIALVVDLCYAMTQLAEYGAVSVGAPVPATAVALDGFLNHVGLMGARFAAARENLHLGLVLHDWLGTHTDVQRRALSYVPKSEPEEMAARYLLEAHLRGETFVPHVTPEGHAIAQGLRDLYATHACLSQGLRAA